RDPCRHRSLRGIATPHRGRPNRPDWSVVIAPYEGSQRVGAFCLVFEWEVVIAPYEGSQPLYELVPGVAGLRPVVIAPYEGSQHDDGGGVAGHAGAGR